MKKLFLFLSLLFFFPVINYAQISQGGKPLSFYPQNAEIINYNVPTDTMPYIDVAALQKEDLILDKNKEIPWRFGQNIDVAINRNNSGINEILPNGDKLWRLRIYSQGAKSINLTFDDYRLPQGAKLFIYNDYRTELLGAFTDFNNQADRAFATTLVKGDAITLEYYEPAKAAFSGALNISRVTHGYRGIKEYFKNFGDAGPCQVNVHCPTGTGWGNQIKSVCMLVTGGSGFCTGALVNNTSNDGTPYILTANHCYSDPTSWVFWFNWEAPACTAPSSSPSNNSVSGSTLKAKSANTDFCLVQMNSIPPTNYGVFYAGWDHSGTPPTSGMGIHHPSGDIKKISPCNAMTASTYSGASCWQTPWSTAACTEPGSSGSPIFDQNKRLVGQLYGGPSACGASEMWDYYGRFDLSWTGEGSNSTRLSNWLDPGSTGSTTLDGYNPNGGTAVNANFSGTPTTLPVGGTVNFTDLSTGSPTSWSWSFTGGTPATSTTQNLAGVQYNTAGIYPVSLTATNGSGSDTETKTNYITVGDMPPVADFIADVTSIPVGGTVNFTDLSAGAPTSWSWTFTGGTPASSTIQNPASIQYNTAGTYAVSLTATNATGSDTETKNAYIFVGSNPSDKACDTLHFPLPGDMVMYSVHYTSGVYGYVSGNNGYSDKAKADFFTPMSPFTKMAGAYFKFGKARNHSSVDYKIAVHVWDNSGPGGAPGNILFTDSISCAQIRSNVQLNAYTYVPFETPLDISSSFYLGVMLPDQSGDTIVLMTNKSGQSMPGTAWELWRNDIWYPYSDIASWSYNVSHAIFPILCNPATYSVIENYPGDVRVYPNPASGILNIDFGTYLYDNIEIKAFDLVGKEVKSLSYQGSTTNLMQFDLSNLSGGIYILHINNGKNTVIKKVSLLK